MKVIDMTGQRFGRLRVLHRANGKRPEAFWDCICDCGNITAVRGSDLRNGHTQSCGCFHREITKKRSTTHGMEGTRLYRIWRGMLSRCSNPSQVNYHNYGGRGIKVCDEWKDYFEAFCSWAMSNGYADNLTIDRIDGCGDYCPKNCRWITNKEQQSNKRSNRLITYNGKTQTMQQWADELGIDSRNIYNRINRLHWDVERALSDTNAKKVIAK